MYCHGLSLLDVQVITLHTPVSGKTRKLSLKRPIIRKHQLLSKDLILKTTEILFW